MLLGKVHKVFNLLQNSSLSVWNGACLFVQNTRPCFFPLVESVEHSDVITGSVARKLLV